MKIPQQIPKPGNRQDFESLCKKLRGEIWECPEIKKHGRQGQKQHGVDLYGIPKGERAYIGIQCKCKFDVKGVNLTKQEINQEIQAAKTFQPPLKKLYFATTADKDSSIEEYIRQKNIANVAQGLFEVHLYAWEDIVDLIKENQNTFNYYVNSQHFLNQHAIDITFDDGTKEIDVEVFFLKTKKIYQHPLVDMNFTHPLPDLREHFPTGWLMATGGLTMYHDDIKECCSDNNLSKFNFQLRIKNIGTKQLDNYKIELQFEGAIQQLSTCQPLSLTTQSDCYVRDDEYKGGILKPKCSYLVPHDDYFFNSIHCIPTHKEDKIIINWEFLSADFHNTGKLCINITTHLIDNIETINVNSDEEEKEEVVIEMLDLTHTLNNNVKDTLASKYGVPLKSSSI